VRQDERLAQQGTSHFVQVADVDEWDIIEPKRAQDRPFRVLRIETVDLVKRSLDGQRAAAIDRRGAAEMRIALEHQHPVPGTGVERRGGQAAEPGSDDNRAELPRHSAILVFTRPGLRPPRHGLPGTGNGRLRW